MSELPLLYHTHHSRHPEDVQFWLDLAARQKGPVLELGCGTGRLLLPLAQSGWGVVGLDLDQASLAFLCSRLPPEVAEHVRILRADMTAFHLALDFSLVLIPCNTFSTLNATQRQAALACIRRQLRPGGILVISMPNPALFKRLRRQSDAEVEDIFSHPADGEPVQVSSGWLREAERFTVFWHYDHLFPDGSVQRTSARASHYIQSAAAWQQELTDAGLRLLDLYGDYDGSAYSAGSPSLIMLAGPIEDP
jgi:SAM-dependent methyltransferase